MERDTAWGCLGFPGAPGKDILGWEWEQSPPRNLRALGKDILRWEWEQSPPEEPQSPDVRDLDVNLCLSRHLI